MQENQAPSFRQYWSLLSDYLRPQKGRVTGLVLLALGSIGLRLANPQIVRRFLDAAETGDGLDRLFGAAALFMGIALVRQVVQIVVTYLGETVAWSATNALRADLALHCLKLDMSFHKQHKPGELIERVDGDVNQLANFFSLLVVRLGGNLLLVLGVLVLLWVQDWRFGLPLSIIAVLGLLALNRLNKLTIPRWQAFREVEAKLFGFLEEWLNGTEEIQTNGAKPFIMLRLFQSLRARWQAVFKAMRVQVLVAVFPLNVFALAYVAAHIVGTSGFLEGRITIGALYVIFYYIDVMKEPLWEILQQVEDLQRATASINRIAELRQIRPTIQDGAGVEFPQEALGVHFDAVTFHYEDDLSTKILDEITFQLEPGKVLGVLGRTGSGKSTLTRLILRFYDPTSGTIRVGSPNSSHNGGQMHDIRQARQADLRRSVSMVTQEVQLFQTTVRNNLTLFDDSIPEERILQVIDSVGLGSWFSALPKGLDSILEQDNTGLSAGEAQLLAFGRVFLTNPGLVILDEASSRLDPHTERLIERAVDQLLENRTGIIIAHRLATVQRADEILILDDGRIAESGRRTDLIRDPNSIFSTLLRTGLQEALT
jgi:ABC-type multidrug transport system fused ATPase/permease subunit